MYGRKSTIMYAITFIIGFNFFSLVGHGDELKQREQIKNEVVDLFQKEKFSELNEIAKNYLQTEERTSSGLWKLTLLNSGLERIVNNHSKNMTQLNRLENIVLKWKKFSPENSLPYLMHAKIEISRAWRYRGEAFAKDVKKENWKPFYEHIAKAKKLLLESENTSSKNPIWYEMMITIIKAEKGREFLEFSKILSEGTERYPYFYQIYFASVDYLKPKWHGSKKAIDEFALDAVNKTKAKEKSGMLARIYWYSSQGEYDYWFANDPNIWKKMSVSIDDVLEKYPDQWNINNFAFFSCIAGDIKKTKQLIDRIKGEPILNVWLGQYDKCKKWGAMSEPKNNKSKALKSGSGKQRE